MKQDWYYVLVVLEEIKWGDLEEIKSYIIIQLIQNLKYYYSIIVHVIIGNILSLPSSYQIQCLEVFFITKQMELVPTWSIENGSIFFLFN